MPNNIIMADAKGGIIVPNLRQYKEITATTDHNSRNRIMIQMEPFSEYNKYMLFVYTKTMPPLPPENQYTFLFVDAGNIMSSGNAILRPNGTIGSDSGMLSVDTSTGTVLVGGDYGVVREGMTICVMILEVPA